MRATRMLGGLAVTLATAGALVVGTGTAFADGSSTPTPSSGPDLVCTQRIPAVLARIDKLTTRINADASTRGSTAWLHAKADGLRSSKHAALADLLDARAGARPERLTELTTLKSQIQAASAKDCTS